MENPVIIFGANYLGRVAKEIFPSSPVPFSRGEKGRKSDARVSGPLLPPGEGLGMREIHPM